MQALAVKRGIVLRCSVIGSQRTHRQATYNPLVRRFFVLACVSSVLVAGAAPADSARDALSEIAKCTGIANAAERLKCFDAAAQQAAKPVTREEDFGKPPAPRPDQLTQIIGKRRVFAPQPTFMLFPRLPAIQFHDREDFPWLDAFEASTNEIRAEARAALALAADDFVPYISKPAGSPVDQWQELNNSKRWSIFFLLKNGKRLKDHLARCPRTAALLDAAPLCEIPGHAPTAFFSLLARVGAETRAWREGHAWVFDDTFEHDAWNESDEPRIVLIFDVWNCFLTAAERDLLAVLTHGVQQQYSEGESPFRQGG